MEYSVKVGDPAKQRSACLVLGVYESRQLSSAAQAFDQAVDGYLSNLLQSGDIEGRLGHSLLLFHIPGARCERVLLIGCGQADQLDERGFRQIADASARALAATGAREAFSFLAQLEVKGRGLGWKVRQLVECAEAAQYRFDKTKSKKDKSATQLAKLTVGVAGKKEVKTVEQALREGMAIAAGVSLAKDLGNLPGNICTPSYLAQQARTLARSSKLLKVKVLDEAAMAKHKMGALLAVSRGSVEPAKLIIMEYRNAAAKQAPVVLVGKGITFDTGGISLKPGAAMDEMKFDMCGAASVLGALKACIELKLALNVIGIIAAAENMPGGKATKPGDIVTSMSGQTVEILNTDAEGRLVLCDALTYSERYQPAAVVDIATLTGACVVALGKHPHGLFSNDQSLADELLEAGSRASDRCWQMPVWEEYQDQLKSNFADMANIGGRDGGAITAACFLARYAKQLRWAHLDIAGTAWLSGKEKGSSGRPVPLLSQYLLDRVES